MSKLEQTWTPVEHKKSGPNVQFLTRSMTLAEGQNLVKGTVVAELTGGPNQGRITAYTASDTNGSGTAIGILAQDVNATAEETICNVDLRGNFYFSKLTAPDTNWLADVGARKIATLDEVFF